MCLYEHFCIFILILYIVKVSTFNIIQFGTLGLDWAKRIVMDDAQEPSEYEIDVMVENIQVENAEKESNGSRNQVNPPYIA